MENIKLEGNKPELIIQEQSENENEEEKDYQDEYERLEQIGEGGFGIVYKVKNKKTGKIYAVKEVEVKDEGTKILTLREIEMMKIFNCPFIVKFVKSYIFGDFIDIIMEYCSNGTLTGLINEKRRKKIFFTEEELAKIYIQMLLGVGYMHRHFVIHRDLKPGNFFIDKNNNIKVGDLGLARQLKNIEDVAHTWCGTFKYISPEVWKSEPYDRRTDIFSLGAIFYKLMTFTQAFYYKLEAKKYILNKEITEISGNYSQILKDWIIKMLNKDFKNRPDVTDILNSEYFIEMSKKVGLYHEVADFLLLPGEGRRKFEVELIEGYDYLTNTLGVSPDYFIFNPSCQLVKKNSIKEIKIEENLPYFRSNGWYALALNTKKMYPDTDEEWLLANDKWDIAFHGIRKAGKYTIPQKIKGILEKGLIQGPTQFCAGDEDLKHPGQKVGKGVYHYEDINEMVYKAGTTADKNGYLFAFQCKIRHEAIMQSKDKREYWVVPGTREFTRPYRLLFRRVNLEQL